MAFARNKATPLFGTALRNLAALAAQIDVAGSGPETENGRGADRKTPLAGQVAVKRLPGTASVDKPGTVPPARRDIQPCPYQVQ
jgi:hypothetical protein